jgi:hypothetical protein
MGLEPNPRPPLNLMGVGNGQKTRSTVQYKVPLVDTRGRTVEVAAYGMGHIITVWVFFIYIFYIRYYNDS